MIYFIQCGDNGPIKIGYTANADSVATRLHDLQVGNPVALHLLCTMDAPKSVEQRLHDAFRDLNGRGEWFQPHPDLLAFIAALGGMASERFTSPDHCRMCGADGDKARFRKWDEVDIGDIAQGDVVKALLVLDKRTRMSEGGVRIPFTRRRHVPLEVEYAPALADALEKLVLAIGESFDGPELTDAVRALGVAGRDVTGGEPTRFLSGDATERKPRGRPRVRPRPTRSA